MESLEDIVSFAIVIILVADFIARWSIKNVCSNKKKRLAIILILTGIIVCTSLTIIPVLFQWPSFMKGVSLVLACYWGFLVILRIAFLRQIKK